MVLLKVHELSVNKESISFQLDQKLVHLWLLTTRSYFKNIRFDRTLCKRALIVDVWCLIQQFKANQKKSNEILKFYSTEMILMNSKCLNELIPGR